MGCALDAANHKLKGLVPQQNGHWGAQIYANQQRVWLGTFRTEKEAAMAYDSASIKLRGEESHRNFAWNHQTVEEPEFQSHYSVETVLNMIRDGTYPSKFATFLRTHRSMSLKGEEKLSCTQLFQKELTPSDVGKLNRLVIPKKHAVTYFPYVCHNSNDEHEVDVEVVFHDKLMRVWKFRYCYWKSSQSYVFTRGWNRFVKDKKLKAKDMVAFYHLREAGVEGKAFWLIDVIHSADHERKQCYGEIKCLGSCNEVVDDADQESKDGKDFSAQKGLRLFGVCIN